MCARFLSFIFLLVFLTAATMAQEIITITSYDGEPIVGRLNMPGDNFAGKIVVDVPGTGPNTYLNMRKIGRSLEFNYHDYFAEEFNRRGIAYFSYSTRYTELDTLPPNFDKVDQEKFFTYTPSVKIKDLEEIIIFLKKDPRLESSRFILLGQSEGTIIATRAAEDSAVMVDALLLCGTPTEDVYSTIQWQFSGEASMINFRKFFDTNGDSIIQKSEYENGHPMAVKRVGNLDYVDLDLNGDSVLTAEDFKIKLRQRLADINDAIETHNDEWLWYTFFRVGSAWIDEHRQMVPNRERILNLDIPVFIFHGEDDANCPVTGIRALKDSAETAGKDNIHVYIFPEHDHSLEFLAWVVRKEMPEGLAKLFGTAQSL